MSVCPDCSRELEPGRTRCPCGALVGTVARRPVQESMPDRGVPAPAKRARIAEILKDPFPAPSRDWARKLLDDPHASPLQRRMASEALEPYFRRSRSPGDDDEEVIV